MKKKRNLVTGRTLAEFEFKMIIEIPDPMKAEGIIREMSEWLEVCHGARLRNWTGEVIGHVFRGSKPPSPEGD